MIFCRKATLEDLEAIWDYNIAANPEEPKNHRWKESFIRRNKEQRAATYVVVSDGEPVGEVTLDFFAEAYGNPTIRQELADGKDTAYVTALRIRKEFEGQGYISQLIQLMEKDARQRGFQMLTIGVEATETRTLAIYLGWGYNRFITSHTDGEALILFYAKEL